MNNIVLLEPDGSLKVILSEDYSDPENRYSSYVGPAGDTDIIEKSKEIAFSRLKLHKER